MAIQKLWKKSLVGVLAISMLAACSDSSSNANDIKSDLTLDEITEKAKQEGTVNSVGMPDTWANWVETWQELETEYTLKHQDTDMSSAEELAKFEAEKDDATADIGDVGIAFGPIAKDKGLTLPYKTSYWDDIPDWAKDKEEIGLLVIQGQLHF
ncbi:ABC transporter substrate-binding protein OS=Lysinibacillus sphaericus OX=1421 GN=LS41612_17370 PE=4 SV=1 [Lysinibacillus sphaericus]